MWLENIRINNFRNIRGINQNFDPGINIIYGMNAQGKTSLLEAVYFCALGRSLRAGTDKELISFNSPFCHVQSQLNRGASTVLLDAHLQHEYGKTKKALSINQVPVTHMKDLFGQLLVVMFSPDDLRLVKAGPSERRRFIDMELCQLSAVYYSNLKEYYRALKQRNALLKLIRTEKHHRESLPVWDQQLAEYGVRISKARASFISRVNEIAQCIHHNITQGAEFLVLKYAPSILDVELYLLNLEKSYERDIIQGTTTVGIHKDDMHFTINDIVARNYGSQGQQRTVALSLKLAEIELIKQHTGETPVLLLDDVFSELDSIRQDYLLSHICNLQTFITCTGVEDVLRQNKRASNKNPLSKSIFKMAKGSIFKEKL